MGTFDSSPRKPGARRRENRPLLLLLLLGLLVLAVFFFSPRTSAGLKSLVSLKTNSGTSPGDVSRFDFSSAECQDFKSQHGEDSQLFLTYWATPTVKRDGVFLEIGALDGVTFSNSYWYERCLGWTGVLVEGHPVSAQNLRKNRPNATTVEAAACEKDEGTVTFIGGANGFAGDPAYMPDYFIDWYHKKYKTGDGEETHEVQCRRLGTILKDAGVTHVDFWTLDVEGAEWTVLHSFDWDKVAVHILAIEADKDEKAERARRHDFLTSKGMEFVKRIQINELWINRKYPNLQNIT